MYLMIKAATALGHFYRLGERFESTGTLLDASDLSETDKKVLADEPNLHIREATEEEIAKHKAPAAAPADDVIDALVEMIPNLPNDAFGQTGMPDLKAMRKLADIDPKLITSEARETAMEKLVKGGFQAPTKA